MLCVDDVVALVLIVSATSGSAVPVIAAIVVWPDAILVVIVVEAVEVADVAVVLFVVEDVKEEVDWLTFPASVVDDVGDKVVDCAGSRFEALSDTSGAC